MTRSRRLNVEALEDRAVPAAWNTPWPDGGGLTLSFAPDGTAVGQQASNLFAALNAAAPTAAWQREVLRAFQAWAVQANINITLAGDGGQPLGVSGKPQADARFGDIRVAGASYGTSVLAFSSPFDVLAATWSGDVRVNTSMFGPSSGYDLYTAFLQEAGHTLGIGNSGDRDSAMYEEYLGPRAGLGASDVAAIRALYGARRVDAWEGAGGNETFASASSLGLVKDANGILSVAVNADLTTAGDKDVYSFRAPTLTTGLVVRLDRTSLVTPRVTVFDSRGRVVGSAESTDPMGGDLELKLSGVTPLGQYYVKVEGVGEELFRVGGYGLEIQSLALVNTLWGSVLSTVNSLGQALTNNDLHTNDSFLTASNLLSGLFAPDSRFDAAYQASISDRWDVDYYNVQAPATSAGDNVMTVMAWGTGSSTLLPRVRVYNAGQIEVATELLVNDAGVVTLQAVGVKPGATYYVRVDAAVTSGPGAVGNYFLGVDFGDKARQLKTFADASLDAANLQATSTLTVHRTAMFHFVLSADTAAGVELTIRDQAGAVVRKVVATAASPVSLPLTLDPATYSFTFRSLGTGLVGYRLKGERITDPIGPRSQDSSGDSVKDPPPVSPGGSDWETEYYWYYWSADGSGGGVKPQDGDAGYRG